MEFRTTFKIPPSPLKITYSDPVMFVGSCFATSIGKKFESGHMPVMINPSGTVYNPVSVANTLQTIISGRIYKKGDLHFNNGIWLSFEHYTDFSSENYEQTISKINNRTEMAGRFLSGAGFLFITFGTARVFRWNKTGKIVSNCHKITAAEFSNELLSVNEIVILWSDLLDSLHSLYPSLKVVFTISPVRHWKDGAHGNLVSKSILFLAVEELLKHPSCPKYFPAYELLMDDLRDYRFYDDDLLHPSGAAIDYIWDAFSESWLDTKALDLWREIIKIKKAFSHRIKTGTGVETKSFAKTMISAIEKINTRQPGINLETEKNYFLELLHI